MMSTPSSPVATTESTLESPPPITSSPFLSLTPLSIADDLDSLPSDTQPKMFTSTTLRTPESVGLRLASTTQGPTERSASATATSSDGSETSTTSHKPSDSIMTDSGLIAGPSEWFANTAAATAAAMTATADNATPDTTRSRSGTTNRLHAQHELSSFSSSPSANADSATPAPVNHILAHAATSAPNKNISQNQIPSSSQSLGLGLDPSPASATLATDASVPLSTVKSDTILVQPKPIKRSNSGAVRPLVIPGQQPIYSPSNPNSSHPEHFFDNVAQLEATAEILSETGSIDEAIRDLHGELKRHDSSRRSSILAASVGQSPTSEDPGQDAVSVSASQRSRRYPNSSASIISTNNAARHGGYSPAAFIKSPPHAYLPRFGSESSPSESTASSTFAPRHGPGKASIRSVGSAKMSLADISESEPIGFDRQAFETADAAPPIQLDAAEISANMQVAENSDQHAANMSSDTSAFHAMLDQGLDQHRELDLRFGQPPEQIPHPAAAQFAAAAAVASDSPSALLHDTDVSHLAHDAFHDFDGVHWQPDEDDYYAPPDHEPNLPLPQSHSLPTNRATRPQSYFDDSTGQQMLYYPARVPAMLNLPPKLSSKPKAEVRNMRRSQVLDAMMGTTTQKTTRSERRSVLPEISISTDSLALGGEPEGGQADAFAALTANENKAPDADSKHSPQQAQQDVPINVDNLADGLRIPQRLAGQKHARASRMVDRSSHISAHVRASAFFDGPSQSPAIAVKDGSAMATLDSILDASAVAPISAFTDHVYAGKLGHETYGKEKKRTSKAVSSVLQPVSAESQLKQRTSFLGFGKRSSSSQGHSQKPKSRSSYSTLQSIHDDEDDGHSADEQDALTSSIDGQSFVHRIPAAAAAATSEDEESDENEADEMQDFNAAPTTLLAELQIRKQQQKNRTQHLTKAFPQGMHATLLEMDAVAEAQRKERKAKRVNLAWEDEDAHLDQNGSDDEDVPLAIIAAKSAGARNMADLERPLGLMERRDMEDNEPLSQRRARLQGGGPTGGRLTSDVMLKAQSVLNVSTTRLPGHSPSASREIGPSPEPASQDYAPDDEDHEGETLGERRRRLAAKEEEAEGKLPAARPVSRAFSEELLSEFGPSSVAADSAAEINRDSASKTPLNRSGEEETLGQRRKRLQAEREARQREMSYGNLVGAPPAADSGLAPARTPTPGSMSRRLSMADVLAAHPKKSSGDLREEEKRQMKLQAEADQRIKDAKMAQMRQAMPQQLPRVGVQRSGGFQNGIYNHSGMGLGYAAHKNASTTGLQTTQQPTQQFWSHAGMQGAAAAAAGGFHGYPYGNVNGAMGMNMSMPNVNQSMAMNGYSFGQQYPYNAQGPVQMPMGMQTGMPMNTGGVNRVEQWRQGVWQ